VAQILNALGAIKGRLGGCEPNALQRRPHRNAEMPPELLGKQSCLVETALALPGRVQWNGNNPVEPALAQPGIIECGDEPAANQTTKLDLLAVLEIEDHMSRDAAAAIRGDSCVEVKFPMRAVRAGKRRGDGAIERLGTFRAKWCNDPREFCFALGA